MNTQTPKACDVAIVGGGLVGASLAIALSGRGLKVCLIERISMQASSQPSYDDRSLALALSSCNVFQNLGIWSRFDEAEVTAIQEVHVTAEGQFGRTRITADELGVSSLGHVVAGRVIGAAVHGLLPTLPDLELLCPAEAVAVAFQDGHNRLTIQIADSNETIQLDAKLLVAADGAQSPIRQMLALSAKEHDYGQKAIIANVTPEQAHRGRAFERFTSTGPMAMLPHVGQRCGLVWSLTHDQADAAMAWSDEEFLGAVQRSFGHRLGQLQRLGHRVAYPLKLVHARDQIAHRAVIMGNAAHTIHPVSAQGFNLGLRDAVTLAELINEAHDQGQDIGSERLLTRYQALRQEDQDGVIDYTDGLVRLFAQPLPLIQWGRSLAMTAIDVVPALKQKLAQRTMGFSGHVPSLAKGPGFTEALTVDG